MGSKTIEAKPGDELEIKVNPVIIPCFVALIILLLLFSIQNIVITLVAFMGILGLFVFAIKNYLIVKKIAPKK